MSAVSLHSVSKVFRGLPALRDFNLDVQRGEFVVLLGPSGCGKTTTLRLIAGLERPTAGTICLGGKDVAGLPPRSRNIGMVFQNYALFPNMTVGENVAFGLRQRRAERAAIEARVRELLKLVRLSDRIDSYCSELSGGEQQRVALARALSFSPQVLLMDEPFSALDLKLRESMQLELRQIHLSLQTTTILVTHDQNEAMTLGDRIVVMADGSVQQIGSPDELYRNPANKFVANFIGRSNILAGKIVAPCPGGYRVALEQGITIEFACPDTRKVGTRVQLVLRPENVDVFADNVPSGATGIPGVVDQRRFLGNVVYYFVRLPWGQTLLVERPGATPPIAPGAQVSVSWLATNATVFETDH
jgi:ABC-type Fe3+/spermidine/putrescine transport system ATPase subunit